MNTIMLRDKTYKKLLRLSWAIALGIHALLNLVFWKKGTQARVFFGGARPGDVGGPLVKVKRLRTLFPECFWGFNLVYTLSNTPYLPGFALWLLKVRKVPIVHNQNGVFYSGWYAGDWEGQNRRMARTFHQADYVFYQSAFCKRSAERYLGLRKGPGEILYNAVDTRFFSPPEERIPTKGRSIRFLLTGKIDKHMYYRVESTIRGLAEAKTLDVELIVAGWLADEVLKSAQHLAKDLGVENRIKFIGRYSQEEAPTIYKNADAYVMTKHNDPCPNTVLEALSCGLPVLYSDTGGVGELVGDCGVALYCEQGWGEPQVPNPTQIAQGMSQICSKLDEYSDLARKRAVEKFDIRVWEQRHREVFEDLLR